MLTKCRPCVDQVYTKLWGKDKVCKQSVPPSASQCQYSAILPAIRSCGWPSIRQTKQSKRTKSSCLFCYRGCQIAHHKPSCLWIGNATRALLIPLVSDRKNKIFKNNHCQFSFMGVVWVWTLCQKLCCPLPMSSRPMHWASHAKALSVGRKCFRVQYAHILNMLFGPSLDVYGW